MDYEYVHNKPIELNETAYYPIWYSKNHVGDSRVEAWEFIVGGGASFNHLNGVYTVDNPSGKTEDNIKICKVLKNLKDFMYSFDFIHMRPDKSFIISGVPEGGFCRGISQTGQQYALYLHHSVYSRSKSSYVVVPGNYKEDLVLNLSSGTYKADWVDPASSTVVHSEIFTHVGGNRIFSTPRYSIDIALHVKINTSNNY